MKTSSGLEREYESQNNSMKAPGKGRFFLVLNTNSY